MSNAGIVDLAKCPKQIRPQAQTHFMLIIITLFSKPMLQRLQSECSNQYKVNTYHYINYQDYGCTLNSNYGGKKCLNVTYK